MKVITPITITDAMLTSSTAPETDYAAYSAGTTYALGAKVIRTSTHRIYESAQAGNTGHTPESSPTWWIDTAPTNRWAMFDGVVGTITTLASPLTIVIAPGAVNSLALLEISGASVDISMTVDGETVYSKTVDLEGSVISDYYEYFFEPFDPLSSVVVTDIPIYAYGVITVTLSGSSVGIGLLSAGIFTDLGETQYGASSGIDDYSLKTKDAFGNTTIVERGYSKQPSFTIAVQQANINKVYRKLASLRAVKCVWIGSDKLEYSEPLIAFGIPKSFRLEVPHNIFSVFSLEIEGLT